MQAVEKFFSKFHKNDEVFLHEKGTSDEFLYLREKNIIHKIPVHEIIYAESMGDNLTIHTTNRSVTSRATISSIQKLLDESGFIRIHRSFLVSLKRITSFSPVSIYIEKQEFPIGTSYRDDVMEKLDYKGSIKS